MTDQAKGSSKKTTSKKASSKAPTAKPETKPETSPALNEATVAKKVGCKLEEVFAFRRHGDTVRAVICTTKTEKVKGPDGKSVEKVVSGETLVEEFAA